MKGHWFASGLACIAIGLYSATHEQEQPRPGVGSVIREQTGMTSTSSISENKSVQETQKIGDAKPHALKASASVNSPVVELLSIEETPFLDPDVKSIAANQNDINRPPVNVGKYLDANGEFPPLSESESAASGIEQTSINVGEYLDPDHKANEPLVTNNGDSGNTHSDVGHYLDPDAEFPGSLSVDPLNKKNVGSLLEVGI